MKLAALSKEYFANGWNIFDLVIVVASLLDLGLESVDGISVMRGMRLVSFVLDIHLHLLSFIQIALVLAGPSTIAIALAYAH